MPRGAHVDQALTAQARTEGRLHDRRSFIAPDGRVFLEGQDVRRARARVFGRDEGCCVDCGKEVLFDGDAMGFMPTMELSHEKPKSLGGDDSDANLKTRCRADHRKHDLHGENGHY